LWLTKNPVWRSLYFWSKIFAVNFGMGVVSGLYQFGTNRSLFKAFSGRRLFRLRACNVGGAG
jgi:cytochrome d ubiquinol oxidase subunit I